MQSQAPARGDGFSHAQPSVADRPVRTGDGAGGIGRRLAARREDQSQADGPLGAALHRVNRPSAGEIYFAAGTAISHVLAAGNVLCFALPMALLTYADTAAAMAGALRAKDRHFIGINDKSLRGLRGLFCGVRPMHRDCARLRNPRHTDSEAQRCSTTGVRHHGSRTIGARGSDTC